MRENGLSRVLSGKWVSCKHVTRVSSHFSNRRGKCAPGICTTSPPPLHLASAIQSHIENFGSAAVDTQSLPRIISIPISNTDRKQHQPNQSCNWCIHVKRAYSIGGPRKVTWFCVRVSCMIAFSVMLPSKNYPQRSAVRRYMRQESNMTFSSLRPPVY
jgi:hypothetical protein